MPTAAEMVRGRETVIVTPRPLCVALSAAAIAAASGGFPVAWAVLTTLSVAVLVAPSSRTVWEAVPVAVLFIASALAGSLLLAGMLGIQVLSHKTTATILLLLVNGVVAGIAGRGGRKSWARVDTRDRTSALALMPFLLMCVLAALIAVGGPGARTGWFLGGDNLRHIGFVTRMWQSGALDYDLSIYPRAWHSVVAAVWTSTGPARDQGGLSSLVATHAMLTWLLAAVLSLALGVMAARLARGLGASDARAGLSALIAGAAVLGPQFLGDYVVRGFETSLLATLILVVTINEVLVAPDRRRTLVVSALGIALVAHTWQIMLPTALVICGTVVLERWRLRLPRRSLVVDAVVLGSAAVFALIGVVSVVSAVGTTMLGHAGDVPKPIFWWVLSVLACCVWALASHRLLMQPVVLPIATVMLTALGIAWRSGVSLESYYPNKTLWTAVVLGLPLLGVAVTHSLSRLNHLRGPLRASLLVGGTVVGLGCLVSMAAPVAGMAGAWSTADGDIVMGAATSASAPQVSVVWRVSDPVDDATTQVLLDFYTASSTSPGVALAPRTADEQCALLRQAREPVVLSGAPEPEVRSRFACVPGVRVVRVGGGS